jgi:hypothetical protein
VAKSKTQLINEAAVNKSSRKPNRKPASHGASRPGYGDKFKSADHLGMSHWQFIALVGKGVLPDGVTWNDDGKLFWKFATLDAAYEKRKRSRRPRQLRGVFKDPAAHREVLRQHYAEQRRLKIEKAKAEQVVLEPAPKRGRARLPLDD